MKNKTYICFEVLLGATESNWRNNCISSSVCSSWSASIIETPGVAAASGATALSLR